MKRATILLALLAALPSAAQVVNPPCTNVGGGGGVQQPCGVQYFVSNTGSDAAAGTTQATAWQTVGKVNTASATFAPGTQVLFQDGGVWRDAILTPASSGTSGSPIKFGSYGSGAQPQIDAANTTTWTQGSGTPSSDCGTGTSYFCSGLESGNTAWTGTVITDSPTISQVATAQVNHGTYSMSFTGSSGGGGGNRGTLYYSFPTMTGGTTYYFRTYMYIPAGVLPASSTWSPLSLCPGASTACPAYLQFLTNGSGVISSIVWSNNYTGALATSSSPTFNTGAWNYIEVSFTVGTTSSNGGGYMWINGTLIGGNLTSNTTGATAISSVGIGNTQFGGGPTNGNSVYFDDFRMATTGPIGAFTASGVPTTVWYTAAAGNPNFVIFGNSPGIPETSLANVIAANEWYWDGSTNLYVYGPGNPASTVELPTRSAAINLNGQSYITFSGLEWRGALGNQGGFNAANTTTGSNGIIITGCTAELNYVDGIYFYTNATYANNNGTIIGSTVQNNGGSGIEVNGDLHSNWLISQNTVVGNGVLANSTNPGGNFTFTAGIKFYTSSGTGGTGSVISKNIVYNNLPLTGTDNGTQSLGIWSDSNHGVTIEYNLVYGNAAAGIQLEKNIGSAALYNIAYNNGTSVQYSANLALVASGEVACCLYGNNNIVAGNTLYGGYWALHAGVNVANGTAGMSNNQVFNNIAYGATSGQNAWFDPGFTNDVTWGSGNTLGYNAFGAAGSGFVYWNTAVGGTTVTYNSLSTYASLDTFYGSSTHSIQTTPTFINAAGGVFTLGTGSSGFGSGKNLGGAYETGLGTASTWPSGVVLAVQPTLWDLGAYAYPAGAAAIWLGIP
jgi:hypothetical protein